MAGPEWRIEKIAKKHDRGRFDCGHPVLNDWLKHRATQFEKRDLARTYVATQRSEPAVLGYYALSNHRVTADSLPSEEAKGLPRLDVPVVLLGRLAVDRSVQGMGLGAILLIDALRRIEYVAQHVGIREVEVDAIDERAQSFYRKFGFVQLTDSPNHLFLSLATIRDLKLTPRQ